MVARARRLAGAAGDPEERALFLEVLDLLLTAMEQERGLAPALNNSNTSNSSSNHNSKRSSSVSRRNSISSNLNSSSDHNSNSNSNSNNHSRNSSDDSDNGNNSRNNSNNNTRRQQQRQEGTWVEVARRRPVFNVSPEDCNVPVLGSGDIEGKEEGVVVAPNADAAVDAVGAAADAADQLAGSEKAARFAVLCRDAFEGSTLRHVLMKDGQVRAMHAWTKGEARQLGRVTARAEKAVADGGEPRVAATTVLAFVVARKHAPPGVWECVERDPLAAMTRLCRRAVTTAYPKARLEAGAMTCVVATIEPPPFRVLERGNAPPLVVNDYDRSELPREARKKLAGGGPAKTRRVKLPAAEAGAGPATSPPAIQGTKRKGREPEEPAKAATVEPGILQRVVEGVVNALSPPRQRLRVSGEDEEMTGGPAIDATAGGQEQGGHRHSFDTSRVSKPKNGFTCAICKEEKLPKQVRSDIFACQLCSNAGGDAANLRLLRCGDVHPNPGPARAVCLATLSGASFPLFLAAQGDRCRHHGHAPALRDGGLAPCRPSVRLLAWRFAAALAATDFAARPRAPDVVALCAC
ncbi:hypothetical protein DIPPA_21663 [Diplonema papillatum]|nr:hypothetical protein DIPPA_01735 [Diplonema papillatum]KAJ9441583.1 hypothetical protein DIPPA_21663 [Diplonema papillatum]